MTHDYHPWTVRHYNHADIALGEAYPQSLSFSLQLKRVGSISYGLDLEQDLATRTKTNPYITDFKLFRGHEGEMLPIMGGIHTSIDISEAEDNLLNVGGKDWLHYFEKDEWPFDPTDPILYNYKQTGRDIALVVKDILDTTLAQPNSLALTYTLAAVGQLVNYKIEPADTEKILSKLDELSKIAPGFDFEITHDRIFKLYAPQKTRTLTGFALKQGHNIENLHYTENGPQASKLRGFAQATTRLGYVVDDPAQTAYRRLVESVEFSDVTDANSLQEKTIAEASRMAAPAIEFSCSFVNYDNDLNFWGEVTLGDKIHVQGDLGYDMIDDYFRFVGIEVAPTDEGDEQIDLTFDNGTLAL